MNRLRLNILILASNFAAGVGLLFAYRLSAEIGQALLWAGVVLAAVAIFQPLYRTRAPLNPPQLYQYMNHMAWRFLMVAVTAVSALGVIAFGQTSTLLVWAGLFITGATRAIEAWLIIDDLWGKREVFAWNQQSL